MPPGALANGVQSHADLDEASQLRFNKLVTKAKDLAREGYVRKALELNQKALKIYHSEKLARRIAKMEVGFNIFKRENWRKKTKASNHDGNVNEISYRFLNHHASSSSKIPYKKFSS